MAQAPHEKFKNMRTEWDLISKPYDDGVNNGKLAEMLNAAGFKSPYGSPWRDGYVSYLAKAHGRIKQHRPSKLRQKTKQKVDPTPLNQQAQKTKGIDAAVMAILKNNDLSKSSKLAIVQLLMEE